MTAGSTGAAGLVTTGLTVDVQGSRLLDGADLVAPSGAITALLGASGAGKSTLLRAVAGLTPSTGSVEIAGTDVSTLPAGRRGVGIAFQAPRLLPDLTVVDNVTLALRAARVGTAERRRRGMELLDRVGLADRADDDVAVLSGGEAQRVNLLRALAGDPDVLLLDEPFSAVDAPLRVELRGQVHALVRDEATARSTPMTTVLVTHDVEDVLAIADHVVVLDDGRVVQQGPRGEVFARPVSVRVAGLVRADQQVSGRLVDGAFVPDAAPDDGDGRDAGSAAGRPAALDADGHAGSDGRCLAVTRTGALRLRAASAHGLPGVLREVVPSPAPGLPATARVDVGAATLRVQAVTDVGASLPPGRPVRVGHDGPIWVVPFP